MKRGCWSISGEPARGKYWTKAFMKICAEDRREMNKWVEHRFRAVARLCRHCLETKAQPSPRLTSGTTVAIVRELRGHILQRLSEHHRGERSVLADRVGSREVALYCSLEVRIQDLLRLVLADAPRRDV